MATIGLKVEDGKRNERARRDWTGVQVLFVGIQIKEETFCRWTLLIIQGKTVADARGCHQGAMQSCYLIDLTKRLHYITLNWSSPFTLLYTVDCVPRHGPVLLLHRFVRYEHLYMECALLLARIEKDGDTRKKSETWTRRRWLFDQLSPRAK